MIVLKHVLVASDFGEPAAVALAYGRELARAFGATLHLVHVVDEVSARLSSIGGIQEFLGDMPTLQARLEADAREALDRLLTDADRTSLKARAIVLTAARPSDAILDYARRAFVDLIVAGTYGRGGVTHLLMGSVAERLVRSAPCPVLTVRPPEHEVPRPS